MGTTISCVTNTVHFLLQSCREAVLKSGKGDRFDRFINLCKSIIYRNIDFRGLLTSLTAGEENTNMLMRITPLNGFSQENNSLRSLFFGPLGPVLSVSSCLKTALRERTLLNKVMNSVPGMPEVTVTSARYSQIKVWWTVSEVV